MRNCPICKNTSNILLRQFNYAIFDDSPLDNSYNLVLCDNCKFIFYDTKNTLKNIHDYYTQNLHYIITENSGTGSSNTNEKLRYIYMLSLLQKYKISKNSTIIDIGSAKGGFLSFLKMRGYNNLLAIDLLPECINYIRSNKISAEIGSIENLSSTINNKSADVIILSHILEHVIDLQLAMEELNHIIKDNGLIYVEVPIPINNSSFKDAPLWDYLYEHINYFSTYDLIALFKNNNFICLEFSIKEIQNGNGKIQCCCAIFKKLNIYKLEKSYKLDKSLLEEKFYEIIKSQIPCYVWGISEYMQLMIKELNIDKCNIISYLDNSKYKQTKTINKIPIQSPEILKTINNLNNTIIILPVEPYANSMNNYLDEINFAGERIMV